MCEFILITEVMRQVMGSVNGYDYVSLIWNYLTKNNFQYSYIQKDYLKGLVS